MPLFRATSHDAFSTASNKVGTDPSGTVENDLLIACIYRETVNGTNPITGVPAGWSNLFNGSTVSAIGTVGGQNFHVTWYWIKRGASAPAYTWSWATSCGSDLTITSVYNQRLSGDPFSFGTAIIRDTSASSLFPDISGTTLDADELLFWFGVNYVGAPSGTTPPSSPAFTERWDMQTLAGDISGADKAQAAAGATGTVTGASWAGSSNAAGVSALLGIRPVVVGSSSVGYRLTMAGDRVLTMPGDFETLMGGAPTSPTVVLKVWNGSAWVAKPIKNGASWLTRTLKKM